MGQGSNYRMINGGRVERIKAYVLYETTIPPQAIQTPGSHARAIHHAHK